MLIPTDNVIPTSTPDDASDATPETPEVIEVEVEAEVESDETPDSDTPKKRNFFVRAIVATGSGIKRGTFATGRTLKRGTEGFVDVLEVVSDHTPGFVKSTLKRVGQGASVATGALLAIGIADKIGRKKPDQS